MCDLLIAFYRKHLDNPIFKNRPGKEPISLDRIMRISKIGTTIGKAIVRANEDLSKQYEADIGPADAVGLADMVDPDGSKALLFLVTSLGLEIVAINRYVPEEGKDKFYEIHDTGDRLRKVAANVFVLEPDYENTGEKATADNYKHFYHWIVR
jgi:hypothetical protein